MNGVWKTFFIFLPFIIILMVFYWRVSEVEIEYPQIRVNNSEVLYDINYKYKTTLIPFIYDFTKEGRNPNYDNDKDNVLAKKVNLKSYILIDTSEMEYEITDMYIIQEGEKYKKIYEGEYISDISNYITEPGVYRIALYCKLYKMFYYDGYVDYKFKIEVE